MEQLLGKFQNDLGTVSEEIKQLQTQSQTMSIKLKNRRAVEEQLGTFIGKMAVSKDLIDNILDAEVCMWSAVLGVSPHAECAACVGSTAKC